MILALLLLLQTDPPLKAESKPWKTFEFNVGGYLAGVDTSLQVKGKNGVGASTDIEDLLGLDSSVLSLRIGASVAMADRHRLHFDYFDVSRHESKTLGRDVEFDGTTYPVGTDVDTHMGLQLFNLTYGYSFFQDSRLDMAVTFGIHGLRTRLSLDADALGVTDAEKFFLPIPLPGFRMDVAITPKLWLRQRFEFMWLGIDRYEGLLTDLSFALEYELFDHVALGFGYNTMRMKLRMKDNAFPSVSFEGEFDFQFSGLQFYVKLFF
jgi:hypothetical protein